MAGLVPFNRYNTALDSPVNFYNMLDDFFNLEPTMRRSLSADTFKIDLQDTEQAYIVEAELPGYKKEEVDIEFDNDQLTIAVNHVEEKSADEPEKHYLHKERRFCSMKRGIYLHEVDPDAITAKLEAGILTVEVPKKSAEETTKKISIG